jgi:hypothetical protein
MKALALLLFLVAGQYGPANIKSLVLPTEALTRAAPTLATDGVELKGATADPRDGVREFGADNAHGLRLSFSSGTTRPSGWARNRALDLALGAAGKCETFPDIPVPVGVGRVLAAPSERGRVRLHDERLGPLRSERSMKALLFLLLPSLALGQGLARIPAEAARTTDLRTAGEPRALTWTRPARMGTLCNVERGRARALTIRRRARGRCPRSFATR